LNIKCLKILRDINRIEMQDESFKFFDLHTLKNPNDGNSMNASLPCSVN